MPAGRRTRSGRAAPVAPMKRIRTKGGCLTCRIRRKKCDESREFGNGGCETCARLHIECLGYSTKRPEWLKGSRVDDFKRKIKHFLADHNAKSSTRGQDEAFLHLHHLSESSPPPRHHSESAHSDSDSDSVSYHDVKHQEPSPPYVQVPLPPTALDEPVWTWTLGVSPVESYWPQGSHFDYDLYGSEDAEGSPVCEYSSFGLIPVPLDPIPTLPDNMQNDYEYDLSLDYNFAPNTMPELVGEQIPIQVMVGSYEHPLADPGASSQSLAIWGSFLTSLRLKHLESALYYDPEGAAAVAQALGSCSENPCTPNDLSPEEQLELASRRHHAMSRLLKSGYNKAEARAVTSLWMMAGSLRQGYFDCWGNCLDIILGWVHRRLSALSSAQPPFALSSLESTERIVLARGLWTDLVASAIIQRVPSHIDMYCRLLSTADADVADCPNKVTLAFAEAVALAANPTHIPQAQTKLDKLRKDLHVCDSSSELGAKARIHTAGVRLYLETVANRGMADSSEVQDAVQTVCQLLSETEGRREFAFWLFLAGCHTVHQDQWPNCRMMMDELIEAEGKDVALEAASEIMNDAHDAHRRGGAPSNFWIEQMRQRGILLA